MFKNKEIGVIVFLALFTLTLPCWAAGTVDELYGKKYGKNLAFGKVGNAITGSNKLGGGEHYRLGILLLMVIYA